MKAKLLVLLLVASSVTWWAWPERDSESSYRILVDRIWIDHIPMRLTEKADVLMMSDAEKTGLFVHTSAYEGDYASFAWELRTHHTRTVEIDLTLLQQDTEHQVRSQVFTNDCDGFDYCIDVAGAPRGASRYYSMKDWVIEGNERTVADLRRTLLDRM